MDQVPQNVDGQEVLNNVLADQPALLADNQPVDHNRGNQPAVDAVVSARLVFFSFRSYLLSFASHTSKVVRVRP